MQYLFDLPLGTLLIVAIVVGIAVWRYRSGKRQFTLRWLLIGMFLVSLPLAWFAKGMREYLREQSAIAKLREAGIDVRTDNFERPLESIFFGNRLQQRAFAVYADKPLVSPQHLVLMGNLPHLHFIRINQGDFSDDDLANLSAMRRLRELTLRRCPINGAGLKHVSADAPLEDLDLSFSPIEDSALEHIARWKSLEQLKLAGTEITDGGLNSLVGLEQLTDLSLDHTAITDAGIRRHAVQIGARLSLRNTEVSQAVAEEFDFDAEWLLAPSQPHRRAATRLLLQGIDVHVSSHEPTSCMVSFGKGWKLSPETGDLLRQLCPIRSVTLRPTHPADAAVPLLANLKELRGVRIEGPAISQNGVLELSKQDHPRLHTIDIADNNYSPVTLSPLAAFPSLQNLHLHQVRVAIADVPQYAGFRQLKYLSFRDSMINEATVREMQQLLPNTQVLCDKFRAR